MSKSFSENLDNLDNNLDNLELFRDTLNLDII